METSRTVLQPSRPASHLSSCRTVRIIIPLAPPLRQRPRNFLGTTHQATQRNLNITIQLKCKSCPRLVVNLLNRSSLPSQNDRQQHSILLNPCSTNLIRCKLLAHQIHSEKRKEKRCRSSTPAKYRRSNLRKYRAMNSLLIRN